MLDSKKKGGKKEGKEGKERRKEEKEELFTNGMSCGKCYETLEMVPGEITVNLVSNYKLHGLSCVPG